MKVKHTVTHLDGTTFVKKITLKYSSTHFGCYGWIKERLRVAVF